MEFFYNLETRLIFIITCFRTGIPICVEATMINIRLSQSHGLWKKVMCCLKEK